MHRYIISAKLKLTVSEQSLRFHQSKLISKARKRPRIGA